MAASGSTATASTGAAQRSAGFVARSSPPLPITALASSTANAVTAIITAAVEKPESHSFCNPVPASEGRNRTSATASPERKSRVLGTSVSVRVDRGGRLTIQKKKKHTE